MLMHDIYIFVVTETKLDDTFPISQFNVEGFNTPYSLNQNKHGRGIILYIPSYIITSKPVLHSQLIQKRFLLKS